MPFSGFLEQVIKEYEIRENKKYILKKEISKNIEKILYELNREYLFW